MRADGILKRYTAIDRDHLRKAVVVSYNMHDRLRGAGKPRAGLSELAISVGRSL